MSFANLDTPPTPNSHICEYHPSPTVDVIFEKVSEGLKKELVLYPVRWWQWGKGFKEQNFVTVIDHCYLIKNKNPQLMYVGRAWIFFKSYSL